MNWESRGGRFQWNTGRERLPGGREPPPGLCCLWGYQPREHCQRFLGPQSGLNLHQESEGPSTRQCLHAGECPTNRKPLCCLAQNPPPSPVPERCVTGGHPDHNPRGGDQCPYLHLTYGFPPPRLARWGDEHSQR